MLGREPGHPSPKAPSLSAAAGPKEESSLTSEARMEAPQTPVFPGAELDSGEQLLRPSGGSHGGGPWARRGGSEGLGPLPLLPYLGQHPCLEALCKVGRYCQDRPASLFSLTSLSDLESPKLARVLSTPMGSPTLQNLLIHSN